MSLADKLFVYFYLVGILHICGLQAYMFMTNQYKIRVGTRAYRYEVYFVTAMSAILLLALFINEVVK